MNRSQIYLLSLIAFYSCTGEKSGQATEHSSVQIDTTTVIQPVIISDSVAHDTDDPAIWIDKSDPSKSLVLGTDKNEDGALYIYDLNGKIIKEKVIRDLRRPNNVDVAYGLIVSGKSIDIAVVTERMANKVRIYSLWEFPYTPVLPTNPFS